MLADVQVLISVCGLAVHRGADGAISVPSYEDVQKGELAILLLFHGKLDVRIPHCSVVSGGSPPGPEIAQCRCHPHTSPEKWRGVESGQSLLLDKEF